VYCFRKYDLQNYFHFFVVNDDDDDSDGDDVDVDSDSEFF
jgi:hypothetical protein